jgi:hypothetical protein
MTDHRFIEIMPGVVFAREIIGMQPVSERRISRRPNAVRKLPSLPATPERSVGTAEQADLF